MTFLDRAGQLREFISNQLSLPIQKESMILFVISGKGKKTKAIVVNDYVSDLFQGFAVLNRWQNHWITPALLRERTPLICIQIGPLDGSTEGKSRRVSSLILAIRDLSPAILVQPSHHGEIVMGIADFAQAMAEFERREHAVRIGYPFSPPREGESLSRIVDEEDCVRSSLSPLPNGTFAPPSSPRETELSGEDRLASLS